MIDQLSNATLSAEVLNSAKMNPLASHFSSIFQTVIGLYFHNTLSLRQKFNVWLEYQNIIAS